MADKPAIDLQQVYCRNIQANSQSISGDMKLKCRFGTPHYGWLPVEISTDGFQLDLDVSDVPGNPIDALVYGLGSVIDGLEAEVWLHLEPSSYYLRFTPREDSQYGLCIEFSERDTARSHNRDLLFEATGSKGEIVLPFWRACKEFVGSSYDDSAWPKCDEDALARLSKLVKLK